MTSGMRKWLAIGAGIGIEIRGASLHVVLVRVRPSGAEILAAAEIADFENRPAAEWGREYTDFVKRHGGAHLAAAVLLPRREVIVRQLAFPGVANRDLAAAIQFQSESLHPYGEDEAALAWARVAGSETVLVGLARRAAIERYASLFAEAGVKIASFTFSAAALYSAVRLLAPPAPGFLGVCEAAEGFECYGESAARPVFSAALDMPRERAAALAAAELRLPPETEPAELSALLPQPKRQPEGYDFSRSTLAYAVALAGACPRLALPLNLLPAAQRSTSSRAMYVPTIALLLLLAGCLVALASIKPVEDRRYLTALELEITRLEPQAFRAGQLDRAFETARARTRLLEEFRAHSKADLDAVQELTRILPPPTWLSGLELTRDSVALAGQSDRAGELLKTLDASPLFANSDYTVPLVRADGGDLFRIRAGREAKK